jgi:molybdenum cofactor biosynthesis enzyme MoaA
MNDNLKGLRIITNLHCDRRCNFCYQGDKQFKVLPIETLKVEASQYPLKHFEYCTVMGGESTLLKDLDEYIKIGNAYSQQVRLTTHGGNLTHESLRAYEKAGLTGVNISVPTLERYKEVTGSRLVWADVIWQILLAKAYFPNNIRVNIPLCKENVDREIKDLIEFFLHNIEVEVTICEDVVATYSLYNTPEKMGATFVKDTGYGLTFFDCKGKQFGYYSHSDNYKNTDLVVTPLGTYIAWDEYCEAVGINHEN